MCNSIPDCRLNRILERPPEIFSLMELNQVGQVQTFLLWVTLVYGLMHSSSTQAYCMARVTYDWSAIGLVVG